MSMNILNPVFSNYCIHFIIVHAVKAIFLIGSVWWKSYWCVFSDPVFISLLEMNHGKSMPAGKYYKSGLDLF
jgi:hypothetical protein